MTNQPVPSLDDELEWVEVKALQRFNISKRPWSQGRNIGLTKGEKYILPRGVKNGSGYAAGMKFYFENNGFLEVTDANPNLDLENQSEEEEKYECSECGREFDSEKGMKSHKSQKHKNNKDEGGE